MKIVKTLLIITAVGFIGFFLFKSQINTNKVAKIDTDRTNPFVQKIENQIDSLSNLPNDSFNSSLYDEITYYIENDYKAERLGSSTTENEQMRENLSRNLYSAYTGKFISHARYIFRDSNWDSKDINTIASNISELKASPFLAPQSPAEKSLKEIQSTLDTYYEVGHYIQRCKSFKFTDYSLFARYPIDEIQLLIQDATNYLNSDLGYVDNCIRLKEELHNVPATLFTEHIRYLNSKIYEWQNMYENYNSQIDYANNLYNPLKSEVESLSYELYKTDNFRFEYDRLMTLLKNDSQKAYNYFNR